MISVALFIDGLGSGGAQKQLCTLAVGLKRRGYNVTVYYYHDECFFKEFLDRNSVEHCYVQRKSGRFNRFISLVFALQSEFKTKKITDVIAFLEGPSFYSELLKLFMPSLNVVVSERFMTVGNLSFKSRLLALMHILADRVTVNSRSQYQRMLCDFPYIKGNLHCIYNGYESPWYKNAFRRKDEIHFLVVSSVAEKKNPFNLIKAAAKLKEEGFKFKFLWAGATYISSSGSLIFDQCQRLIQEYQLVDEFIFLGEVKDVYSLYRDADWLVHPAFYEGLPNAICEAISVGLPVVASNVCDHPFLVDSTRGILFEPDSVDSIFSGLLKAIETSDDVFSSYVKNNIEYFENNLRVDYMIDKYINLLRLQ